MRIIRKMTCNENVREGKNMGCECWIQTLNK